jgi:hypothetical protein
MFFFNICWHEWNKWMCLLSVYVNVTFECVLYVFFIWIYYLNVFMMVCFYNWNLWMFSCSFVYINGIFGCFVRRLFIRMEYVNVFVIACLNESNLWMFPLIFAYLCFSCVLICDLDSFQVALIKIAQFCCFI